MKVFSMQLTVIITLIFSNSAVAELSDDERFNELLQVSGVAKTVDNIPQMFVASAQSIASQNKNVEVPHTDALVAIIEQAVKPALFTQEIVNALQKDITADDLTAITAWYTSDAGKEITLAEVAAGSETAQIEMRNSATSLMQNDALVALAQQINIATNAGQQLYSISRSVGITMYATNTKLNEPTVALDLLALNTALDAQKAETMQAIEAQMLLFIAYSMQDIDADKVDKYIQFLNSEAGSKFVKGALSGLNAGFNKTVGTLVESINLVFDSDDWRIDTFLTFSPPEDEDLTFQAFPELDLNQETIAAWSGDDLNFFYHTVQQNTGVSTGAFWDSFQQTLQNAADRKKVELIHQGTFTTNTGDNVEFKIFMWREQEEVYTQIVNLIDNGNYRYAMQAFPLDISYLENASIRNVKIIKGMNLAN